MFKGSKKFFIFVFFVYKYNINTSCLSAALKQFTRINLRLKFKYNLHKIDCENNNNIKMSFLFQRIIIQAQSMK